MKITNLPETPETEGLKAQLRKLDARRVELQEEIDLLSEKYSALRQQLSNEKAKLSNAQIAKNPDVVLRVSGMKGKTADGFYRWRSYNIASRSGRCTIGRSILSHESVEVAVGFLKGLYDRDIQRSCPDFDTSTLEFCPHCRDRRVQDALLRISFKGHCPHCGVNLRDAYERGKAV